MGKSQGYAVFFMSIYSEMGGVETLKAFENKPFRTELDQYC
jgi:hypothetical protein